MPRKTLSPDERRKTIAFTITGDVLKRLDNFIARNQYGFAKVNRQTVLENILATYLNDMEPIVQKESRP